ncbi:MAG: non-canonical purine NTP diphosphatase [Bacteroidetes bacterium]|nr:non-canonical purine NTP diphosphatase [Bacteroidota bacterium]
MKKLVFATNNPHKLEEVHAILQEKFEVAGLADIGCTTDIPETGTTLQDNASIKSHFVVNHYKLDCFADDTGLEVQALGGRPGVYSARYAGENASYEQNVDKLLTELNHKENRKARFRTVISLMMNHKEYFFEGVVNGRIINQRKGNSGFGYDPVFVPDGYDQTFAEMDASLKNSISHRGKAIQKLADFLLHNG